MSARALRPEEPLPPRARRAGKSGLLVLGWGQFWLLSSILGSLLALFIAILLVHLSSL